MITVDANSISVNKTPSLIINGKNDLGVSSESNISLTDEKMNALRIMLKMIVPRGELSLLPSDDAVFHASIIKMTYSDGLEGKDDTITGSLMRAYKSSADTMNILISPAKFTSDNAAYLNWYESKSKCLFKVNLGLIGDLIDSLDKIYPFEQFRPENEPSYKYIDS